jgi:hypothetical protein
MPSSNANSLGIGSSSTPGDVYLLDDLLQDKSSVDSPYFPRHESNLLSAQLCSKNYILSNLWRRHLPPPLRSSPRPQERGDCFGPKVARL